MSINNMGEKRCKNKKAKGISKFDLYPDLNDENFPYGLFIWCDNRKIRKLLL
jgi:hypothetical protein